MPDHHIADEWIAAVEGTSFFYPCAGGDHDEPLSVFQNHIDTFWFSDINYRRGLKLPPVSLANFCRVKRTVLGAPHSQLEMRTAGESHHRFIEPSKLVETYERRGDGRRISIIRRRGFGQIALTEEFKQRSLGVFMHRGDSTGEGGSNVFFLANIKKRYEPLGNLFDKLADRLADRAMIISDGSNTSIPQLRVHRQATGCDAFSDHHGHEFGFGGFRWCCVGWLGRRYGPTLVWGLTRQ